MTFKVPEKNRVILPKSEPYYSDETFGNNGLFSVRLNKKKKLRIIASDGGGWDHVSVSLKDRVPSYFEMKLVRRLFWGDDDVIVEYHMGKTDHVNCNNNVLHLWRCQVGHFPTPPKLFV